MVGDRGSTDGLFAVTLGCPYALVRSGVTQPGDAVGVPVAIDAPDLARRRRCTPAVRTGPVSIARWPRTPCRSCSRPARSSPR